MPKDGDVDSLVAALWGRRAGARERRPVLNVPAVVCAAVSIAQTDGAEAVSMNRIAKRLGCSPMALYRYVTNKQELMALMVESALEAVSPPVVEGMTWRRSLTAWAWAMEGLFKNHRWLAALNLTQIPFGPRRLAWLECGITALSGTGLTEKEKVDVVQLINGFVFADAQAATDPAVTEDDELSALSALAEHIDAETYPAVINALDDGAFIRTAGAAGSFEFGLERILDGVEILVARRAPRTRRRPSGDIRRR